MIELKLDIPVWMRTLTYLYDRKITGYTELDITTVSFELRITYSHTHRVLSLLRDKKYITTTKDGRTLQINLTRSGVRLGRRLYSVMTSLKEYDTNDN